jgi:NADH dehydrogenase
MLASMDSGLDVVTGAFGNTGAAIAARLRADGRRVRTLTNHPPTDPAGVEVHPLAFDDRDRLAAAFDGAATFFNTFWMRQGDASGYDTAVARSQLLMTAAADAGVQRIVHLSVVKPSLDSPYPYFRAKARVEEILYSGDVPAAIVRPALIFGGDNALLHNLAWLLRKVPVFAVPGDGRYRVRPVHVDDVADLCVTLAQGRVDEIVDAVGPQRPTFDELVYAVREAVGARTRIVHAPAALVLSGARILSWVLRDDLLDRDELRSTMEGLADADGPATGTVEVSAWLAEHGSSLGLQRINERQRRG